MGEAGSLCSHPDNHHRIDINTDEKYKPNSINLRIIELANAREPQVFPWTIRDLRPHTTIRFVRKQIAHQLAVDTNSIVIYLGSRPLHNGFSRTLSDYDITEDCAVFVSVLITLQIKRGRNNYNRLTLKKVPTDITLYELRQRIERRAGIAIENQILYLSNRRLDKLPNTSDYTLAELGITRHSLTLRIKNEFDDLVLNRDIEPYICEEDKELRRIVEQQLGAVSLFRINKNTASNMATFNRTREETKLLFHGTSLSSIVNIINVGFQRQYNHTSAYGKGTYFARDASFAAGYTRPDANGYRYMFAAEVIVGKCRTSNSKIYVAQDGYAIPRYLIMY